MMIRIFLGIILFLLPKWIIAQNQNDSLTLTLPEAIERGLLQNDELAQNRLQVESARLSAQEIKANQWPSIDITASYTRNIQRPVFFLPSGEGPFEGGGVIEAGYDNSYNASASLNMPLFNMQLLEQLDVADASEKISQKAVETKESELATDIEQTYFNALLAKESVEVLQLSVDNAEKNLNNVKNLFQQGVAPEFDVLRAEVELENIRADLIEAKNNRIRTYNRLKLLIDLNITRNLDLQGDLRSIYEDQTINNLSNYSLQSNPNYQHILAQRSQQEERIEAEKAAYFPNLSLFGNYQYQTQANSFDFGNYRWVNTSSAGVRLNIPVFAGFQRNTRIEQAQVEIERIELQQNYLEQSLSMQANNSLRQIQLLEERIEAQQANIRRARKSYNIAVASYQKGTIPITEVNDAELAFTQARLNAITAIHDYLNALANYEQVTNKDLITY